MPAPRLAVSRTPALLPLTRRLALALLALPMAVAAADKDALALAELSLEELANTRVISVSKKDESLAAAPASIFVITADSIRRSGVATLPEALRLAPNLQVARVDARNYAVTARGFNSAFENKLLVLIDGRSVYSPLFSGVYWDAQDVLLEDVERIEVISGPGGTLWGANAVNGVINVITKRASATRGAQAAVVADEHQQVASVRYGAAFDNGGSYRIYAKSARDDDTERANGTPVLTGWKRSQAGFRADWGNAEEGVSVHGDAYAGSLHQAGTRDITIGGANLTARAVTPLANGSRVSLQAYWDHTERDQPNAFVERLDTFDAQAQHTVAASASHQIVWGAGYRLARDRLENGPNFGFLPASLDLYWGNVFVQDQIALSDTLQATLGLKLENNNYTGVEMLPTLRLAWQRDDKRLLWSALSRSVRAPSRIDRDFYSPASPPLVGGVAQFNIAGGPDFDSEVANVFELGYRAQPSARFSYSATAYLSRYQRLRTLEPNTRGPGSVFRNLAEGRSRGIEMWANWQASQAWRLSAGLVTQHVGTSVLAGSRDTSATTGLATSDPSNFWSLRSAFDLGGGRQLDLSLRHVGRLRRPAVDAYDAVDLHYGWRISRQLELGLTARNAFDTSHAEFGSAPGRSEYPRSVAVKLVWRPD